MTIRRLGSRREKMADFHPPYDDRRDHLKAVSKVWDNLWDKFPHNRLEAACLLALRLYNLLG